MSNSHVHPIFAKLLEDLDKTMSKPRTQAELDAWNSGARQADATWWQDSWERGPGRTYKQTRHVNHERGTVIIEQEEDSQ